MTAALSAPPWIAHDGSGVCPVPAGHDVEREYASGMTCRDNHPETHANWHNITHYRDWTAFARASEPPYHGPIPKEHAMQANKPPFIDTEGLERLDADFQRDAQASEALDEIPLWAHEKAEILANEERLGDYERAFARYIAAHEPAPVDPLRELFKEVTGVILGDLELRTLRARLPATVAAVEGEG